MLELKNVTKIYPAGGENVKALKGISLQFRESEFVSILGPSGCGKTTMLNIIGGLDKYNDGDLIINGKSTKEYKARDWDSYRNHSVGFVFQSYNLIPHQTVLTNVELALTLSGVSKAERRKRAKEALEKVGLKDQMKKRPGEMSGGQMQRVAIARAIVNNPDIILADEPTGALDTETSVQVMDILKEIAKDRLVIMVTHNPDLAEKYSTRIVKMLDGVIKDDSAPLSEEEYAKELESGRKKEIEAHKTKKPSMSLATAFGLSLKNLFTKKGRTILTSFAGSIGIIGIALIYAVSNGMTEYIDSVQEQTLSSYPITIESTTIDMSSMLNTFMGKAKSSYEHPNDAIYQKTMMYELINALTNPAKNDNDLVSFRKFIENERSNPESKLHNALSGVQYAYDTNFSIYTKSIDGNIIVSDTTKLMYELIEKNMKTDMNYLMSLNNSSVLGSRSSTIMENSMALWKEMLSGANGEPVNGILKEQYDLLCGRWPEKYDEIILFVDEHNELNDLTLYALGLKNKEELETNTAKVFNNELVEYDDRHWGYDEICNLEFRTVLPCDYYVLDETTGKYKDLRTDDMGLNVLYDKGLVLKVTGIVRPSENAVGVSENGHIGYTSMLTDYVIEHTNSSDVVKAQNASKDTDVISGLPFKNDQSLTDKEKADIFKGKVQEMSESEKAGLYREIMITPSEALIEKQVEDTMANMDRDAILSQMIDQFGELYPGYSKEKLMEMMSAMDPTMIDKQIREEIKRRIENEYGKKKEEQLSSMTTAELAKAFDEALTGYDEKVLATLYEKTVSFSSMTYEEVLSELGVVDLEKPSKINLFANSFENKDVIAESIEEYNANVEELKEIHYTDIVGILMSSVTTIINAITYVLIAFVSVSLIVSSIMIGVITLISVQERTKEIGILRAIGASKRNVSNMFNAETVIIGFTSGMLGVIVTYLFCIPINIILHTLTGISNLSARLPIYVAAILVLISMLLTLIAGVIPSRSAAKKDPVVALRTE